MLRALLGCPVRLRASAYFAVLPQLLQQQDRREAYQVYMAESLWALAHGRAIGMHYPELFSEKPPKDGRTPGEVIAHMKKRLAEL